MINDIVVLGQVPGTSFQITFYEYLILLPLASLFVYIHRRCLNRADLAHFWLYARIYLTTRPGSQLSLHL